MTPPSVALHNCSVMPMIGLGTRIIPPENTTQAIQNGLDTGYQHIDCSPVYENEHFIGMVLKDNLEKHHIEREELFVTSKLWNTSHRPDLVQGACETTLRNLKLKYLDLYLLHWPMAFQEGESFFPKVNKKIVYSNVDYVSTWQAMERLVDSGHCRAIGLSNFNKNQILRILDVARISPAVLQIECHPYLNQKLLMAFCKCKSIPVAVYNVFGKSVMIDDEHTSKLGLMKHPIILQIAKAHNRAAAEVLIRYQTQRGNAVICTSNSKAHMTMNLNSCEFSLSDAEITEIDKLNNNTRMWDMKIASDHPYHPFVNDEY